ncbi:MAG: sulfite exporter TauE/SafE family protein [Pseudomonadota bacterium]
MWQAKPGAMSDLSLIAAVVLVFLVAGTVKGVAGIGLPAVVMGLATLFLDARLAIALLLVPMLVSNIWQIWRTGGIPGALRRYWLFALVMMITIYGTALIAAAAPEALILGVVGVAFVLFALANLVLKPPPLPDLWDRPAQVTGGFAAGVLGGLTAIWSPPIAIYLSARQVDRDEFVRGTGLLFTLAAVPLLAGYWRAGLFTGTQATLSMAMVVPTLAGFAVGEAIRRRIPSDRFRLLLNWVFLALGANLIRRALFG